MKFLQKKKCIAHKCTLKKKSFKSIYLYYVSQLHIYTHTICMNIYKILHVCPYICMCMNIYTYICTYILLLISSRKNREDV